jgi:transposase
MPCNPTRMPRDAARIIVQHAQTHTTTEIARMLLVSSSTVRVWARVIGVRCRRREAGSPAAAESRSRARWIFDLGDDGGT